jgi:hypothetical protein
MPIELSPDSKIQRGSRWAAWVLVFLHGIFAALIASRFGEKGMEWWPIVFAPIDFPVSIAVILIAKHANIVSEWGLWFAFLLTGSIWHFYWPQALVWVCRLIVARLRQHRPAA